MRTAQQWVFINGSIVIGGCVVGFIRPIDNNVCIVIIGVGVKGAGVS